MKFKSISTIVLLSFVFVNAALATELTSNVQQECRVWTVDHSDPTHYIQIAAEKSSVFVIDKFEIGRVKTLEVKLPSPFSNISVQTDLQDGADMVEPSHKMHIINTSFNAADGTRIPPAQWAYFSAQQGEVGTGIETVNSGNFKNSGGVIFAKCDLNYVK